MNNKQDAMKNFKFNERLYTYLLCVGLVFGASCKGTVNSEPEKGLLEVNIKTSGEDYNALQKYSVVLDEIYSVSAAINDKVYFTDLDVGKYLLKVNGLAENCMVEGEHPKTITLEESSVVTTSFNISCEDIVLRKKIVCRYGSNIFEGLYILKDDGSDPVQLTNDSWDSTPVISPDGTKVAFTNGSRDAVNGEFNNEIYVVDASGSPVTRLTFTRETTHINILHGLLMVKK